MIAESDGSLFVGTGNEGKVFRIDPQGKGSLFFDSTELEAHALAPAPNGGIYVGTSPDGRIYKVDRNGNASPFFSSEDKYIWALAVDAKGNLFAAHRRQGDHLQDRAGRQRRAVLQDQRDARHRARLRQGRQPPGRYRHAGKVLRIDPEGKAFVLLDSPFQEIRALRFDDKGTLYVAALSGRPGSSGGGAPAPTDDRRRPPGGAGSPRANPVGVRRGHLDVDRRRRPGAAAPRRGRIAASRRVPSIASLPTASGTSSGSRATTRRTISPSIRTARSSSAPAARARSTASRATRRGRRCWRAPARSR